MNEMINVCLEQMSDVCMIVHICSSEEVCDGNLAEFLYNFVWSFSYLGLYDNLDLDS